MLLWSLSLVALGQTFANGFPEADLVPAALGIRTDKNGNSWNIEPNGTIGRIGSTMVNSGLDLSVNDEKFVSFQPLMTSDGKEFVLRGRPLAGFPGLQVQRRIRLSGEAGALRYAEMFYNGSTDPVSVSVSLATNFSGNYKTFLTDRGRTEPVLLKDSESGIVVLPGATQSTRAFLFSLAESSSSLKPTISAQNRYGLTYRYPLRLEPGETGIILHYVAQVVIPQNFDRRNLQKLFRPYSFAENEGQIPSDWKDYLLNTADTARNPAIAGIRNGGLATLGIEPGPNDILAIGSGTRLTGRVEGADLQVSNEYGQANLALPEIAAIVGKNGDAARSARVFLRDGQIVSGEVSASAFSFSQTGGGRIDLEMKALDRLVMASSTSDSDWASGTLAMIETYRGDRFKVPGTSAMKVEGVTPWGRLPVDLEQLVWLGPAMNGVNGHWVELKSGLKCLVFLAGAGVDMKHPVLGDLSVNTNDIKSIFTPEAQERNRWNSAAGIETVVAVEGDQTILGDISNTTLPVVSGGTVIETAVDEIRRIKRVSASSISPGGIPEKVPGFEIERWDGGTLSGFLLIDAISLKVEGQSWRVPVRDIVQIDTPSPELTPETLAKIKELIEDLASPTWMVREKATRDLGAFGYLARPVLKKELQVSDDPEVSHRLERILSLLN
ncbi:MAG: hypothetical protein P1U87_06125 [Verrucomicrobiales bacterium]|nr:hypothetical protein [Verrucomicrobiales bacterium]